MKAVNNYLNGKIKPVDDQKLYGKSEYWTYPAEAGDCEDLVLLKKRYLVEMKINPDELLITVVVDENGDGHAVLTVATDQGDLILDNRRNEIMLWQQSGYKFIKRQSQPKSIEWVSLRNDSPYEKESPYEADPMISTGTTESISLFEPRH